MYGHDDGFNMLGGSANYAPLTKEEIAEDLLRETKRQERRATLVKTLQDCGVRNPAKTVQEFVQFLQLEDAQYCGYPDDSGRDNLARKYNCTRRDIDTLLAKV